jgi:hypothetical protein
MVTRRIAWAVAGLLASGSAMGEFKPDPTALIKDLESVTRSDDRFTLALWLPTEFWRVSLEGKVTPQQAERFLKEIDPYVVVAIVDGAPGIAGSVTFSEPELVRNAVTIEDTRGNLLSPLPDAEVSGGVRNLTQMMRPMFANMLGALGSHLAFVVFAGTEKGGHRTVEPGKEGTFSVHVGTATMRYRLPLASLLPPAIDEKTGESFPGNYQFNPFTGTKLTPAPADAAKGPPGGAPAPAETPTAPAGPKPPAG